MIDRPQTSFEPHSHTYQVEGHDVLGVSTVAKIGEAEDMWGIASAWGFRIGYEGALEILGSEDYLEVDSWTPSGLRDEMKARGLTPWSRRDKAAERGTWVHNILEVLADGRGFPTLTDVSFDGLNPEQRAEAVGHVRALMAWYVDYRPEFVATEVQVASRTHGFAGRYDIRALIDARRLVGLFAGHETAQAERVRALALAGFKGDALCLIDLKTSKGVYPTSHFPQLAGYEGGGVEMGFPVTDAQLVLNTHPDGTYDFVASWAQFWHFLAYLAALRAIRDIKAQDPQVKLDRRREEAIMAALPARSRDLAASLPELRGLDGKAVGIIMSRLRKRGLVTQAQGLWSSCE